MIAHRRRDGARAAHARGLRLALMEAGLAPAARDAGVLTALLIG